MNINQIIKKNVNTSTSKIYQSRPDIILSIQFSIIIAPYLAYTAYTAYITFIPAYNKLI